MIEAGIYSLITSDPSISALIGNRLYPVLVPETATFPCCSYQSVSSISLYTLDGRQFTQKRIQVDSWATTYASVKQIDQALKNVLDTYSGTLTDGTQVLSALSSVSSDQWESDSRLFRIMSEYTFQYYEA